MPINDVLNCFEIFATMDHLNAVELILWQLHRLRPLFNRFKSVASSLRIIAFSSSGSR